MKGKITISRYHGSEAGISIEIQDEASRIRFIRAEMGLKEFAEAITGLGCCAIEFDAFGLEHVGKVRVTERRSIRCPLDSYDRTNLAAWLREHGKEDGWIVNDYLGSQGSITRDGNVTVLNYQVVKYVEQEPAK